MNLNEKQCTPCLGGVPPYSPEQARKFVHEVEGWELTDNARRIHKMFKFHDFGSAWKFADRTAQSCEMQGHHADIEFGWGYCNVSFQTQAINGLHDNDFIMAAKINDIAHEHVFEHQLR